MTTATTPTVINGLDAQAVRGLIETIKQNPAEGMTRWGVTTRWTGGMTSTTTVSSFQIGGRTVEKDYQIHIDEPLELGGTNTQANPQEYLMAAVNACMGATYVALCALHEIELESLEIETEGNIDLRGFLAIDPNVLPGYDQMRFNIRVKGNATPEQFQRIHAHMQRLSPNFFNMATAIPLRSTLTVA